jgi:DNA-binding winged helix-turn-helix (wHTH) protein
VTFQFGPFLLDTNTRQLRRGEREVTLPPKAFQLLSLLVENRSRAMSRQELHEQLWPSTFVLETNLAGLIAEVRRALEDAANAPAYIRTVQRFGYQFTADVHEAECTTEVSGATSFWLVWQTRQVSLSVGENIVGRSPEASVWIDADGVSRRHARIVVRDNAATLEDLGSKNGTFVGAVQVTTPWRLTDGDQIRLGSVVLTFRVPQPPGTTNTAP